MSEKKVISGAEGVAIAVKLCKPKVLPMYPITPSTLVPEKLSEFVFNGEIDAQMIHVESEHSAISALYGAYATGVRAFTATASQGLALMHEIIPIVSGARFPAVMFVANRALSGPLNIWNDHSDSMSERDQGWIQLYCESNQEAFDTIIMAYKIAESKKVLLPVMVCADGFYLTHAYEPIQIEEQKKVDKFLPKYEPVDYLDTNNPKSFGAFAQPNTYMEFKEEEEKAMREALKEIIKVNKDFEKTFGRKYGNGLIEGINLSGAEHAILCVGSVCGTVREVIKELKKEGKKVGLIKLKSVRPLPVEDLKMLCKDLKVLGVIDRHASIGFGGALTNDIRSALMDEEVRVEGFIAGLGGRDINKEKIRELVETILKEKEGYWLK
ncbi:MAG: transketolase C-terminal domain-containing protein [Candidatus Iainarchaeum sp.]|jgi:pyruvate ferredoxin oxidoreductase alpha subunit|nr:MAG: Pyruvate synthase subunit PorA [archaeon ADurb.Bin336]